MTGSVIYLGAILDLLVLLALVLETPYAVKIGALAAVYALKGLSVEFGLFLQKLYVVLCTPDKNTREAVLRRKRTLTGSATFRSSAATHAEDAVAHVHADGVLPLPVPSPTTALESRAAETSGSARLATCAAQQRAAGGVPLHRENEAAPAAPRLDSVSSAIGEGGGGASGICAPAEWRRRSHQQVQDPDVSIYSIAGSVWAGIQNSPLCESKPQIAGSDALFLRESKSPPLETRRTSIKHLIVFVFGF